MDSIFKPPNCVSKPVLLVFSCRVPSSCFLFRIPQINNTQKLRLHSKWGTVHRTEYGNQYAKWLSLRTVIKSQNTLHGYLEVVGRDFRVLRFFCTLWSKGQSTLWFINSTLGLLLAFWVWNLSSEQTFLTWEAFVWCSTKTQAVLW